jgi:hypothetical protein
MTNSSTEGIKTVLHPVSDLANYVGNVLGLIQDPVSAETR